MFAISGAPLDEVWGLPKKTKNGRRQHQRINTGPTKMYDDIIDAYIDDFENSTSTCSEEQRDTMSNMQRQGSSMLPNEYYDVSPYMQNSKARDSTPLARSKCTTQVIPVMSSDYVQDAMEYQDYYKPDNMFIQEEKANHVDGEYHQQHIAPEEEAQQQAARPIETYHYQSSMNQTSVPTNVLALELALYVLSGILLIFILEQILHLGLYLR